jgi:hypothetical protein
MEQSQSHVNKKHPNLVSSLMKKVQIHSKESKTMLDSGENFKFFYIHFLFHILNLY